MDATIRPMTRAEFPLLSGFLYEAIFIPEGAAPPPRTVLLSPPLRDYVAGFGSRRDDRALVAEAAGRVVGAVWVRCGAGFGRVAEGVPELAAALDPACRGRGVGTRLLRAMLRLLADEGYPAVSLAVQKANPAVRLDRRLGFRVVREHPEEYVMVCVPA